MALVRCEKATLKYLVVASFKLNPLTPRANRKGELVVAKCEGLFSYDRVVLEVMTVFEKVLRAVLAKMTAKLMIRMREQAPPEKERY